MALSNAMNVLTQSFLEAYDDRIADVVGICTDTAQKLSEFNAAHQRMSAEQRQKLSDQIESLRSNVAATLNTLDANHRQMAADLREKLASERERLLMDVSAMRASLQIDHAQARKTWSEFNEKMRQRRAKGPSASPKKAPTSQAKSGAPAKTARGNAMNDDLTLIPGIGANRQTCLNGMGIFTFTDLGSSTPEKIRKAFGATGHLANVEQWIKDARKLRSKTGR